MFKLFVLKKLNAILALLEKIMALSQDIKDLTTKLDAATTAVATRLDKLQASIKNSMTDAEVADVKSGIQAEIDKLTLMGQDPVNPIPNPPTP